MNNFKNQFRIAPCKEQRCHNENEQGKRKKEILLRFANRIARQITAISTKAIRRLKRQIGSELPDKLKPTLAQPQRDECRKHQNKTQTALDERRKQNTKTQNTHSSTAR